MKKLFTMLLLVATMTMFSQTKGISCMSTSTHAFEFSDDKGCINGNFGGADESSTNIFTFSFKDSLFIHTVTSNYRSTVTQIYKITETEISYDNAGNKGYSVTVLSGSSGSNYYYFIRENLETGYIYVSVIENPTMSKTTGVSYRTITKFDMITYEQ